jgi:hypothetical protein
MDYKTDIEIDEDMLDVEFLNQASLFMKYSQHYAQMRRSVDEEKQSLDVVKAEVDRDIRENPANYNIEKVTEGTIQSAILTSKKYKTAYTAYLDAKYESDMAGAAVQAFEQRKVALENLVKLHGQQYFAGPRVPHNLSEQRKAKEAEKEKSATIQTGIASKLKRSK